MASNKLTAVKEMKNSVSSVWTDFFEMAGEYQTVNLGMGFPDCFPPDYVKQALVQAAQATSPADYQYTRSFGHPRLVKALADLYSPIFGRQINPYDEILVSVGAYGCLFSGVSGLVGPGDEVIIIEPCFFCYEAIVNVTGGTPVFVPLRPTQPNPSSSADFTLDRDEIESKFNSKTKAIFINTPNNPLGKIYTQEEMEFVADLCKKHNVIVFADEVYEFMVYPPNEHVKIANLPDMWERTITISSAGKVFSTTGWKTGWAIGPKHLVSVCQMMHQNCVYNCPTPIQEALAICVEREVTKLGQSDSYITSLSAELLTKRDYLAELFRKVGMNPIVPEGTCYMLADLSKLALDANYDDGSEDAEDLKFVRWMMKVKKFAVIPSSLCYSKHHKQLGGMYARFCFAKEHSTLEKAAKIIENWN